jgi:hypothetical protein
MTNWRIRGIEHRIEHYGTFEATLRRPNRRVMVIGIDGDRVRIEVPGVVIASVSAYHLIELPPAPPKPKKETLGAWVMNQLYHREPLTFADLVEMAREDEIPMAESRLGGALSKLHTHGQIREVGNVRQKLPGSRARTYIQWERVEK